MADLDASTGHVRTLLRNTVGLTTNGLNIVTEPGLNGRAVTKVRRSYNMGEWTQSFGERLAEALGELPDAEVELRPIRDLIIVVWDGVN